MVPAGAMRRRQRWGVAHVMALAALATQDTIACPTVCQCTGTVRVSVYCDFRGLESVPANLPLETTHLYFMGNRFTRVVPEMFQGNAQNADGAFSSAKPALAKLKVIRFDLNPIAIVNEHAFDPAPTLELIYLPFDVKIQRQAFAERKTDKLTFDGFTRVDPHPLEDPQFAAFSTY